MNYELWASGVQDEKICPQFRGSVNMKIKSFLFACAAVMIAACGQTAEEKVKAYEEAHEAMMTEYQQMMDSLATDRQAQEEFYNAFVEKYIDFNLEAAK